MDYTSKDATELGVKSANVASLVMYGKVVGVIIGGITFIIVAKLLGASGYGLYTIALGAAGLFGAFANLSIGSYFQKRIPELYAKKNKEEVSRILGSGIVIMLAVVLVITAIGLALNTVIAGLFNDPGIGPVLIVAFFSIISAALFSNFYSAIIAFGEGYKSALGNILNTLIQAVVSISLVVLGFGPAGAVLGVVLGQIAGALIMLFWINKHSKISISLSHLKKKYMEMLSFSVPLTISGIVSALNTSLPVILLGIVVSATIVGSYGVSIKIWNLIDIILGSISLVLIPMFASAYAHSSIKKKIDKLYNYSIYFGFLFTAPAIVYIIVFSGNIVNVLFSASYTDAPLYISLAAFSLLVGIIGIFGASLATSKGDVKKVLKYSAIVFIIQTVLLGLLIFSSSALGLSQGEIGTGFVVIISVISSIVTDILYMNYIRKDLKLKINYNMIRLLIANLILAALFVSVLYLGVGQLVQMIVGMAVLILAYPLVLGLIKAISNDDITLIRKSTNKIPVFGGMIELLLKYAERVVNA